MAIALTASLAGWVGGVVFYFASPTRCKDLCPGSGICPTVCILEHPDWALAVGLAIGITSTIASWQWVGRSRARLARTARAL